jgi:phosphate transport system protein
MAVRSIQSPPRAHPLFRKAEEGFVAAIDAARNLEEFLRDESNMALMTVRACERDLDQLERHIDEQLPKAVTRVDEATARDLITSLRFISDLERIGDLCAWVGKRVHSGGAVLSKPERAQLGSMVHVLLRMLTRVHEGLLQHEPKAAEEVLRIDSEMDRMRHDIFQKVSTGERNADLLLMAQAFERAGDHATNLAEELFRWLDGHSIRHRPKHKPES